MIPTPEQLEEISQLGEGTLGILGTPGTLPFAALLLSLSSRQRTLVVEVRRKQMAKRIVLEHGVPIDCRSNLVHETLGRYMVAQGKLAPESLHGYLGESASLGLPLGEVLLDHDVVTAEELYRLLQENLAKKLLDVFTWRDGEFRTLPEVPHPQSPLKIRVAQLIVTGIAKFAPQEEVDAGVVPLVGKKLCLHPQPPFALDEIRLNQRQSQVVVALRSGWRIDELALGTGLPFEEITRLLYALAILGVVITAEHPAARTVLRALKTTAMAPVAGPDPAAALAPATAPAAAIPTPISTPTSTPASTPTPTPTPTPTSSVPPAPPETAAPAAGQPAAAQSAAAQPAAGASAAALPEPSPGEPPPPPPLAPDASGPAAPAPPAPLAGPGASATAGGPAGVAAPASPAGPRSVRSDTTATRPMPALAVPDAPPVSQPVPAPPAAGTSAAASTAPSAAPEAPPAEPAVLPPERRRNEIMQAYLSYRRLDAFDLLGADEDASPAAVEVRYLDFARRFAPWTLGGPEFGGMEEKARDLFLAGARAYAELLDLEQRNALLFRRKARREERDRRPPADLLAIKTDLLDPEIQYRKGRALLDAGRFQEAALLLEFASDCDPQNGLYSAELAYCRFCLAPGQGARALKELQETLRRDPDCGLAVYYTGEIHRQMGNRDDAEGMLRRAIKMMSPDRRPIEALKLLAAEKRH
ncbi:MAG TPA: DUF4388 domain-containing protein [Thermoanaerobaculia bacterium]|nr:DUF4388 domain-containing protein [Thermoanaerobaculia bacterium]